METDELERLLMHVPANQPTEFEFLRLAEQVTCHNVRICGFVLCLPVLSLLIFMDITEDSVQ